MSDDLRDDLAKTLADIAKGCEPSLWAYQFKPKEGALWVTVAASYGTSQAAATDAGMHLAVFPEHIVRLRRVNSGGT